MSEKKKRYKTIEEKTGISFLTVASLWLIWGLFFPLYKGIHFIILIILSVILFFITDKYAPKRLTQVEITDEPIFSSNTSVQEVYEQGMVYINEIEQIHKDIKEENIHTYSNEIISLFRKMLNHIKEDPQDVKNLTKFMNYYLPTIIKLLDYYKTLENQAIEGENITESKKKILSLLETTVQSFRKQLDHLFTKEAIDISTDITVMKNMLASQGLNEDILKL